MRSTKQITALIAVIAFHIHHTDLVTAQTTLRSGDPITLGQTFSIKSDVLDEEREVWIYTPRGIATSKVSYPVIYVFDASSLFQTTATTVRFMNYSSEIPQIPEAIVIGIPNTDRMRDMPIPQRFQQSGGASRFKDFITKELMPSVEKQYRTNGLNIIIGHSQGGLFVNYLAAEAPDKIKMAISLDAPMTINESLSKQLLNKLKQACQLTYIAIDRVFGWPKDFSSTGGCWTFTSKRIREDNHETMPLRSIYAGLQYLFNDFPPVEKDMTLTALKAHFKELSDRYDVPLSIPKSVLLSSARRRTRASRKADVLELLAYHDALYGADNRSKGIQEEALKITKEPDPRVDHYLNLPTPSKEKIAPYLGKWRGTTYVTRGQNMEHLFTITMDNGKLVVKSDVLEPDGSVAFSVINAFAGFDKDGSFVFGRKHGAGGVYVSSVKLSADGQRFEGMEDLIGVEPPPGIPPYQKNRMEYKKVK